MDVSGLVPGSPEMTRARQMLEARAAGRLPVRPDTMPMLTDQECIRLSMETPFEYEAIRKAFPWRVNGHGKR